MGKYDTYVDAWRDRLNKEKAELEGRHVHALRKAKECAEVLKKEFGAKRVILYGSVLHPDIFTLHSDIDLAVEGIKESEFYYAGARVDAIAGDITVDLTPIEDTKPYILDSIEEEGIIL
ncbi:MAG: nucleotidyltransferase domain-containing protein [Ignavibacteriae bacterium]|nr:nucleotidyltransferase domain-containing protein [Ignavibacteriota bacterium]